MSGKDKARKPAETKISPPPSAGDEPAEEMNEEQSAELASAANIPRPATSLAAPPKHEIGRLSVALLVDPMTVPSLEDLEKAHKTSETQSRVPLMTVIHGVLKESGGSMTLASLAAQVKEHWHRPLPASPYSLEEFVYVVVRNADTVRVSD